MSGGPRGAGPARSVPLRSRPAGYRVSLGPNILRAETAAIAALAVVASLWQAPA